MNKLTKEYIIKFLKEIDMEFYMLSNECESQKNRKNESYYNGYQSCCDDVHTVVYQKINEVYKLSDDEITNK